MQLTARSLLTQFAHVLQTTLFPLLEETAGPLSAQAQLLVSITSMIALPRFLPYTRGCEGRPLEDRQALACAFIAKAVYGMQTTRQLIERLHADAQLRRLCGWNTAEQVPHESTFSRTFAEFARTELPQRIHEALIQETQSGRLIGHIARDSTAIVARERFPEAPKEPKKVIVKRKRGRPRKDDTTAPAKRLERQRQQSLTEMLEELPTDCGIGVKTASDGNKRYWRGYKLHVDVADGQIPVTSLLTSASVHDSQVAIPLATITATRVTSLYDLMDAAYDATHIREHSRSLGHVPIIAANTGLVPIPRKTAESMRGYDKRRQLPTSRPRKTPPLELAEKQRYAERSMSERVNARLKDEFGASSIRVRGAKKIMAHLMFGVLALTVDQLLKFAAAG
jgi:Transposase DDE domain/Transposase domain (DUF772)